MNEISVLVRVTRKLTCTAVWGNNKCTVCDLEEDPQQNPTLLTPFENFEKGISVVYKPPNLQYL